MAENMIDPLDGEDELTPAEWRTKFKEGHTQDATAELAAKFMFAMSYYHDRMRLHMMLHPLFFLVGFLTAFFLGE